ncbi:hypothetical protein A2U01_0049579 [Trifolium medium]|uniref:Uncharacterized protein n=1 Tax=Trifolium medium TaxID=97028 RepID=A0A392QWK1_9FABA|nr:hypothetical protein [Trifolium medium]
MRKGTSKACVNGKKKSERGTSAPQQNKVQKKLKIKQEVVSPDSDKTDSDCAEFLETYDPSKEDSDYEEEVTKELLKTEESKKEDPK